MSTDLHRHVSALVSDFAAEYGTVDLVGRRVDVDADEYDALVESFESVGVVGGAGIRIVRDGEVLLLRYEGVDGWIEPGDGRRPGESYRECARRGLRRATGTEGRIDGLAQIQLVYLDDPGPRAPIPNPYVSFRGAIAGGTATPRGPVADLRWADEAPREVAYEELRELPFGDRTKRPE
jgi:ADP-ribose pyrophosphatase YjhB (NUDIX family)